MIPNSWLKACKELGVPAAAMLIMFAIGIMFWNSWTKQIAKEGEAKQELLTKFVDSTIATGKEQTANLGEMKTLMSDLRGLNRKARENDAELLVVQKSILGELRSQNRMPAPKPGKGP